MKIHAAAEWYRSRPEPEQSRSGLLLKRDVPAGPGTRAALRYMLVTQDQGTIPIYAPPPSPALNDLVGRRVIVRGKLVDLTAEGFGVELWIGAIGPDADAD